MCEDPSFYYETFPRAAKEHRCCECRRVIQKGEYHHHAKGVWDGSFGEYRTCWQCQTLRLYLIREGVKEWGYDYCFGFGELAEQWHEFTDQSLKDFYAEPPNDQ